MTLSDFLSMRERINRISKQCDDVDQKTNEILSICENAGMPDKIMGEVDAVLTSIKKICYNARDELQEYSFILNDISRNMEIPWPPACKTGEKKP